MKISIVGGGPAGLYFALLMKKADTNHHITVYEQNPAGATYGWGVVFSGKALSFLAQSDSASYTDIEKQLVVWDDQHIGHRDQIIAIDGSKFAGIARLDLLQILQKHCLQNGVDIQFETRLDDLNQLINCDLIVGADGVNSWVREHYQKRFQPATESLNNYYIWYGTHRVFGALSLIFRENDDGYFVTHTYPYSKTTSTFIVECDVTTWQNAGFADKSNIESRAYCEEIFANDLRGLPLLDNKSSWLNFRVVHNQCWYHDNVILLGDALRSVHFSIGSGTRTALEDAITLFDAFQHHGDDISAAFRAFETERRVGSDKLLNVAQRSLNWYEHFGDYMHLAPLDFAYSYVTRGGRVDDAKLRQRSPRFMQAYGEK